MDQTDDAPKSASADEVNNLDRVARRDAVLRMKGSRNNLAVDLYGNGAFDEPEQLDELPDRHALGYLAARAVDGDLHAPTLPSAEVGASVRKGGAALLPSLLRSCQERAQAIENRVGHLGF